MLSRLKTVLRALLRRTQVERELDEEMRNHIGQQTEQNIRLGMNPEEARYAARKAFGGVEQAKERSRDARGLRLLQDNGQDLRYGARMLLKNPGFTLIAICTLALGIGANTAIFSVMNAVLIRSLPYAQDERLVILWGKSQDNAQERIDQGNFFDWKEQNSVFADMAAFYDMRMNLTGDVEPEEIPGQRITANLFSVLGINPILGRTFTLDDNTAGRNFVIVISYNLWQRRFGGDPQVIGRKLILHNFETTIIGVMPPDFKWHIEKNSATGQPAELWWPLPISDLSRKGRFRNLTAVARLKPGVTIERAQLGMELIGARLEQQYPDSNRGYGVNVVPLRRELAGEIRLALLALMGAVGFVLLIACANVANLLLARAATRQKEIAVRAALGAGRGRIVRQLLTESALLACLGGAAGLALAVWGVKLLASISPPELTRWQIVQIDATVLGFTFAIALLTGIVFGLAPAYSGSRLDLTETLKETGRSQGAGRNRYLRHLFVIAEIALALVLLVG